MPPAGLRPRLSSSPTNSGRSFGTGLFHVAQRGREKKAGEGEMRAAIAARLGFRSMLRPARQRNGVAVLH